MGDVAGGLADISNALGGAAKQCQIASIANEMAQKNPMFKGVRDPEVLKLLFEKQRLDNDTMKAHELSLLYAANARKSDLWRPSTPGPKDGNVAVDWKLVNGEYVPVPRKVAPSQVIDPTGATDVRSVGTKPQEQPSWLEKKIDSLTQGGNSSAPSPKPSAAPRVQRWGKDAQGNPIPL